MQELVIDIQTKREYILDLRTPNGENPLKCPACSHERNKKNLKCLGYNAGKGVGKCNHCGASFVKKNEDYVKIEKSNKPTFYRPIFKNNTNVSDRVVKWFESRKISQKTLLEFKIGEGKEWMPQTKKEENTIQFNYFVEGELINTKFRDGAKNFKLIKDAELVFYNLDAIKHEEVVIIVEGELDALSFHEAGVTNVISVPNGATKGNNNLTYLDNCAHLLEDKKEFWLATDNDVNGNNLREELARRLGFERCYRVYFEDCKDANECLIKHGITGIFEAINSKKEYPITGVFSSYDIEREIDDYYVNGLPEGCGIKVKEFDELLKFHLGYITTITGIPGHGKSEFLDYITILLNINYGWKFGVYSPENHPLQLHFSKYAEKMIGKPFSGFNKMNPLELDRAKEHFAKGFFFIKPEENFTLENILSKVKSLILKKGINAFIIDAWNKLEHNYTTNETKYISEQLDRLALFCEANKVHLFLVAHPTKINKDKSTGMFEVPNLYSINGSANFYNKTHNGMSVYLNRATGQSEIYIQKVKFKHWGKVGRVDLHWNSYNGRYYRDAPDNTNWLVGETVQAALKANNDFDNNFFSKHEEEVPF